MNKETLIKYDELEAEEKRIKARLLKGFSDFDVARLKSIQATMKEIEQGAINFISGSWTQSQPAADLTEDVEKCRTMKPQQN